MNTVSLIGRFTKDLNMQFTPNGNEVLKTTIAVKDDRNADKTHFIRLKFWRKTAEVIASHFSAGDLIGVVGSLESGSYEKDGQKQYFTEVNIRTFDFIESKSVREERKAQKETD